MSATERTLSELLQHSSREPGIVGEVLPWLGLLAPGSRTACLEELRAIAGVAFESGRLGRLVETLRAWEATALATWDEQRNRERLGYDDDAAVGLARPRSGAPAAGRLRWKPPAR